RESLVPEKKELAIRTVHTMKGNSDYLGLFPITDAALSVLTDLRKNRLSQAMIDIIDLENAFAAFKELVDPFLDND
ncbi:MAG: hypothetical protein Q4G69_13825, partial [Planctomycetia bacterium]|nr:hypothetical protein [Planctomycetia bacterium]